MGSFTVGQLVALRADFSRQGPIIEVLSSPNGPPRYRVFHTANDVRDYFEDQLVLLAPRHEAESWYWLGLDEFRAKLTAARLSHPLTDNLYALHAARIKFIPFQFKPLLRLLRGDRPRLLIADEVGVGKTIEAGLILRELQSRQELENVLIVCPKPLTKKWYEEMRRFDEEFQILTSESIKYCLRETHYDGVWPAQFRLAIVNLELLRNPNYLFGNQDRNSLPGFATLNPSPKFSLVIFDEAHHLRNPDTNSHELARIVCDVSEAVLLLSATPIQIASRNLFTLLHLLRPDLFPDEGVYHEMTIPNKHLNIAIRHIRTCAPPGTWRHNAIEALQAIVSTPWGKQGLANDPHFTNSLRQLQEATEMSDAIRIRCLRDLEEVHTLAHVMNRTRRRDIGRFTIREPHTVSVNFTNLQREFYTELLQFRRNVLALRHDDNVIRLILDMLERQASSCLPALVPFLENFLHIGRFSISTVTDVEEDEEVQVIPPDLVAQAQKLRDLAGALPPEDPKWDALLGIARASLDREGPGKLLVFSYFLHTLSYLTRNLSVEGFRVGLVTGKVEDEDREELRSRFRKPKTDPDAVDILLSSEVGCEGLDYEFCDRMVNYDIPWNPMRLEQRIGRIDRFGQLSEKVLIFNFITPGTVEEKIFFRCYERLGIFRDTIGDCEEVLGELSVTEQLLELARNLQLTPEQAEEKARQITDNALRRLEEQRHLEEEGSNLLGLDQALIDEVDSAEIEGRFVSGFELRSMIDWFLSQPEFGGKIETDRENPFFCRLRLNKNARTTLLERLKSLIQSDRTTQTFRRMLEGSDSNIIVTFDQQTAIERRDIPFITPIHPLARLAVKGLAGQPKPLAVRLRCQDPRFALGRYVFCSELWESISGQPEMRLVNMAWHLNEQRTAPDLAGSLLKLLPNSENLDAIGSDDITLRTALSELEKLLREKREEVLVELKGRNETLISRKLSSLEVYYRNRLARINAELNGATDNRIRRMKESELARVERDFETRRKEIEKRRLADIVTSRLAVGILEVTK